MFVATFYSYKGGVGRSLALANVAADLASRGKSVLVVDFDLEAPGASSYCFNGCTSDQSTHLGIVDFINEWLIEGRSPDIRNFVYECVSERRDSASIWVMPAGKMDAFYSTRLQNIDFSDLYKNRDGFLLIEDMKAQWAASLSIDYVLIDSRTGHTDIGGICTRQLPDLVVFVFWPNAQNLEGLGLIVDELNIGDESAGRLTQRIFVPSNLPTLDDEDDVLKRHLGKFKQRLNYNRSQEQIISNYPSLDLLDQKIFTTYRPNSRLGREYTRLAYAIQMCNLSDEQGVVRRLRRNIREKSGLGSTDAELHWVESVYSHEWKDPEIRKLLGVMKADEGDITGAIRYMDSVIKENADTLADHYMMASWLMSLGPTYDPAATIDRLLDDPKASQREALAAIRLISKYGLHVQDRYRSDLVHRNAVKNLTMAQLSKLCVAAQDDEIQSQLVACILNNFLANHERGVAAIDDSGVSISFALSLISAGSFSAAVDVLECGNSFDTDARSKTSIAFNLAIARWGVDGQPNRTLFERVVDLHSHNPRSAEYGSEPNYSQCLCLANTVIGNTVEAAVFFQQARSAIGDAGKAFSCWSYLVRGEFLFVEELEEQKSWSKIGTPLPRFLSRTNAALLV